VEILGSILTHEAAAQEAERIAAELSALTTRADFPMEILPVAKVTAPEAAAAALRSGQDVTIVYPATGSERFCARVSQAGTKPSSSSGSARDPCTIGTRR